MTSIDLDRTRTPRMSGSGLPAARGWARAGIAGGLSGLAALIVSSSLVPNNAMNDNTRLVQQITDKRPVVRASQVLFAIAGTGLAIFRCGTTPSSSSTRTGRQSAADRRLHRHPPHRRSRVDRQRDV
jgi:hypothetical protein